MLVTLKFDTNGKGYTIERGIKPNIFKFIEDGKESEEEEKSLVQIDEISGAQLLHDRMRLLELSWSCRELT